MSEISKPLGTNAIDLGLLLHSLLGVLLGSMMSLDNGLGSLDTLVVTFFRVLKGSCGLRRSQLGCHLSEWRVGCFVIKLLIVLNNCVFVEG